MAGRPARVEAGAVVWCKEEGRTGPGSPSLRPTPLRAAPRPELQRAAAVLSAGTWCNKQEPPRSGASPWGRGPGVGPPGWVERRRAGRRVRPGTRRPAAAAAAAAVGASHENPGPLPSWWLGSVRREPRRGLLASWAVRDRPRAWGGGIPRPLYPVARPCPEAPVWTCARSALGVNAHPHDPPPRRHRQCRAASADATCSWRVAA